MANDALLLPKPKRPLSGGLITFVSLALFAHVLGYLWILKYSGATFVRSRSLISVNMLKEMPPPPKPKLKPPPPPKPKISSSARHSVKASAPLLHVEQVKFHSKKSSTPDENTHLQEVTESSGGSKVGNPEGVPGGKGSVEEPGKSTLPPVVAPPVVPPKPLLPDRKDPTVLSRCQPAYPDSARDQGIEGSVRLTVVVGRQGQIVDVQVAESSGNSELDSAAVESVRRCWQFSPAIQNGAAVETRATFSITFRLQ